MSGGSVSTSSIAHHHHHQSLNREGRWGTTDDFATSFLHFSLFSTALWDLPDSRPVHSLMLSSHLLLCPPCLLPPFTVPCKMVLARPDEREPQQTQEKIGRSLGENRGEWIGRVEISKEEIPGSKRSMYGYILTYSRL